MGNGARMKKVWEIESQQENEMVKEKEAKKQGSCDYAVRLKRGNDRFRRWEDRFKTCNQHILKDTQRQVFESDDKTISSDANEAERLQIFAALRS